MHTNKLHAGATFPSLSVTDGNGANVDLGARGSVADWKMVVVYRGVHCPLCTRYLNQLEGHVEQLVSLRVDLAAVSADSREQMHEHRKKLSVSYPIYCDLSLAQMQQLGLYVSQPRSQKETDHLFPEPGLFVVNEARRLQVVDISNNPFVRPDLESLMSGLAWIRGNDYPIRGAYH